MALSPLHLTLRLGQRRIRRCEFRIQTLIPLAIDGSCANASSGLTPLRRKSFSLNRQRGKPRMVYGQRLTNARAPFLFQR